MPIDKDLKRAMIEAMEQGYATPAHVADYLGISKQAVHKWVDAEACQIAFANMHFSFLHDMANGAACGAYAR